LRLLIRSGSDPRNIEGLNADRVVGDLRDPASIENAMAGCDVVFHVAADYRLWVRDPQQMYRANVEGTRAILDAARKNHLRRVVYTSSVATMGFTSNGRPADEDSPVSLDGMIGHYKRSKFMAEEVALAAGRGGMDVVVVNPSTPVGERDIKPTPTGRIVVDFLKKKFPAYVDTGLNLVDVTECARGHVAALEKGRSGERYILGGENLTLKQILDKLAAITGLPSPKVRVPYVLALATGVVDEVVTGRILGREPRATIDAVRMGRRCLCRVRKPSVSWDGRRFRWMVRCGGPRSGFRRMGMPTRPDLQLIQSPFVVVPNEARDMGSCSKPDSWSLRSSE
jgi:dihydroflavonol-4-reductase